MGKKQKGPSSPGGFCLDDFSRDPITGRLKNPLLKDIMKWLGHALVGASFEGRVALDYTGTAGTATGIFYSLAFQLGKWEYLIQKASETIDVSPVHAQYYQLTMRQKEELEGRIKSGLASASQSVADLELLLHDRRKYEEMLHYMGYQTKDGKLDISVDDEKKTKVEREKRTDNHSLKAMFIDQVDFHTGEGISMRSIVSRWPTMISDFMRMDDKDTDPGGVMKKLDISRAEAVVLVTKNKLFIEWKNIFLPEVRNRYQRIMDLVRSREQSVIEYKEWLKPYVARHKMIVDGLSTRGGREGKLTSFISPVGHATSFAEIELWVWKPFMPPEMDRVTGELYAKYEIQPDDDWTRKNLIYNKKIGLLAKYPWMNDAWIAEKKNEMYNTANPPWILKNRDYYAFFIIKFNRTNMRDANGNEIEDGVFDVNMVAMTKNVLFVKLLDLKARQEVFSQYIDELLGIQHNLGGDQGKLKKEKFTGTTNFFKTFNVPLQFFRKGPYERDFNERITKYYLTNIAADNYVPIVNFLKQKMGIGGGG